MDPMADRDRPELGPRKSAVLRAVVEQYVRSGEPVGSETIAEAAGLGRLERHDPQRDGRPRGAGLPQAPTHIAQAASPPTPAIATTSTRCRPAASSATRSAGLIAGYFAEAIVDLEEVLKGSVQLLSRLTQYAGLAVPPSALEEPVMRLELIDLGPTVMILAVGQHGRVDKRVIDRPEGVEAATLAETERKLADAARPDLHRRRRPSCCSWRPRARPDQHDLLLHVAELLAGGDAGRRVHATWWWAAPPTWRTRPSRCGGRPSAGCSRRSSARPRCSPCCRTSAPTRRSLNVTIGAEHPSTGEWEASIITAPFKAGETTIGTIGVVGPTRMDYLSAMASVRAVAKRLSEMATEIDAEP